MSPSAISRLRNIYHENKIVLQLLAEIEMLVRTNSLLNSRIKEMIREKDPKPSASEIESTLHRENA